MKSTLVLAAALLIVAPAAQAGGEGLKKFSLTRAVPADAFMAIHVRGHDGQAFLKKQYARVWAELAKARLDRNFKQLFKTMAQEQHANAHGAAADPAEAGEPWDPAAFDEHWKQMVDLWSSVEWSSLGERELAMTMKLGFPSPEFVVLLMPAADKVDAAFDGLSSVAQTLVGLAGENVAMSSEGEGSAVVHKITPTGSPMPMVLTLARQDDVILIGFGSAMPEQSLALLRGEAGKTLASTDRYQNAFKKLPEPTDSACFVDAAKLMKQIRVMVEQGMAMAAGAAGENEQAQQQMQQMKQLVSNLLATFDLWDYQASVATTDGMKTSAESIVAFKADAKDTPLFKALYGNGALDEPLKYVPAGAGDFMVKSGVNLGLLYDAVADFVKKNVPDGEANLTKFEQEAQTNLGLSVRDDVLGWIQGGIVSLKVPGPNSYSPSDWVFMLEVSDETKANAMLAKIFELIGPMLAAQNGSLAEVEIAGATGFRAVSLPMLAMLQLSKPTLGVTDGWLMVGSSPEMITSVLEVAAGSAPNISKNERFQTEGVSPTGAITALSYADLTKFGESLSQALGLVGLVQAFAPPEITKDPMARTILGIIPKLARPARKLDFFKSSSSKTVMEGDIVRTLSVLNYRESPVIKKPVPASSQ